jgi:hypothetical protein
MKSVRARPALLICAPISHLHFPARSFQKISQSAFKAHLGGRSPLRLKPLLELSDPNLVLNCRLPDDYRDRGLTPANIRHPIVLAKRS